MEVGPLPYYGIPAAEYRFRQIMQTANSKVWEQHFYEHLLRVDSFRSVMEKIEKIHDENRWKELVDEIIGAVVSGEAVPASVVAFLEEVDPEYKSLDADIETAMREVESSLTKASGINPSRKLIYDTAVELAAHIPLTIMSAAQREQLINYIIRTMFEFKLNRNFLQMFALKDLIGLVFGESGDSEALFTSVKHAINNQDTKNRLRGLTVVMKPRDTDQTLGSIVKGLATTKFCAEMRKTLALNKMTDDSEKDKYNDLIDMVADVVHKHGMTRQFAKQWVIEPIHCVDDDSWLNKKKEFKNAFDEACKSVGKLRSISNETAWEKCRTFGGDYSRSSGSSSGNNHATFRLCSNRGAAFDVDAVAVVTAVLIAEVLTNKRRVVLILLEFNSQKTKEEDIKNNTLINNMTFVLTKPDQSKALDNVVVEAVNIVADSVKKRIAEIVEKNNEENVTFVFVMGNKTPPKKPKRSIGESSINESYDTYVREFETCASKVNQALNDTQYGEKKFVMLCRFKDPGVSWENKIDSSGWSPCGCRIDKSDNRVIQHCEAQAAVEALAAVTAPKPAPALASPPFALASALASIPRWQDSFLASGFNYESLLDIEHRGPTAPGPAEESDAEEAGIEHRGPAPVDLGGFVSELIAPFDASNLEFDFIGDNDGEEAETTTLDNLLHAKNILRGCIEAKDAPDILRLVLVDDNVD